MLIKKRIPAIWMISVLILSIPVMAEAKNQSKISSEKKHSDPAADTAEQTDMITLDKLIKEALNRNPSIRAARLAVEGKRARVLPEQTLPDPTLSFQTMGDLLPPTLQADDPSSGRTFTVQQEIPFPGKLELKGKIASTEADVQSWNAEQTRRQVVADVKKAYYDYYFLHKAIKIVEEDRGLLQNFRQVAEEKYRVGQGAQQDVLRAQVEISKLVDRMAVLEQRLEITKEMINSLLHRPPGSPLSEPADFEKAEFRYSFEDLQKLAQVNSPSLKMQELEIERNQQAVKLAARDYYPDFAVAFSYVDRDDLPEMYGLMVSAKLPLYFWRKQRPALQGAQSDLAGARKQRDSTESTLYYNLKDGYTVATTSERLIQLYKTALIPQAGLTLESGYAAYQVGSVDFLTILDTVINLLDYQLKYFEALSEFQKALAQLEPLVGIELTR